MAVSVQVADGEHHLVGDWAGISLGNKFLAHLRTRAFSPATVRAYAYDVANLARLTLTPQEEQLFGEQLGQVLGYIEKLKQVDVSNVEPTAHAVPMVNVVRADEVQPSLPNEEALRNAPAKANGLFVVPKIVE